MPYAGGEGMLETYRSLCSLSQSSIERTYWVFSGFAEHATPTNTKVSEFS